MKNVNLNGHSVMDLHARTNELRRQRKLEPIGRLCFSVVLVEHVRGTNKCDIVDTAMKELGGKKASAPPLQLVRATA